MPAFLLNENQPFHERKTTLVLPGITHVFSVHFPDDEYQSKSVAVACGSNDRTSCIYVFDTPEPIEDEPIEQLSDRLAALCIGKTLVKQLAHQETFEVMIDLDDNNQISTYTAKHFCGMAPGTSVSMAELQQVFSDDMPA